MKPHLMYLRYVLLHKWYVFLEGLKLGVPIWGLVVHDWTKFMPVEWKPYALSFYGPWKYDERPQKLIDECDQAWLHHQHHGPHHWQFYVLMEDSGNIKVLEMPDRYRREMLADLHGIGRQPGFSSTKDYYLNNKDNMQLHPNTRDWVEDQLGI
jgi:hypothetical protein